jgi:hypothetical protein
MQPLNIYGLSTPLQFSLGAVETYNPTQPFNNFLNNILQQNSFELSQVNQGPSTPVKYDEQMKTFVPNLGAGRPTNIRLKTPNPFI